MNAIHLGTLMAIIFLFYPAFSRVARGIRRPDWTLAAASLECVFFPVSALHVRAGFFKTNLQATFLPILPLLWLPWPFSWRPAEDQWDCTLSRCRASFSSYTKLAPIFRSLFASQGIQLRQIIIRMALTDQGICGVTLMVSSSYVFMFILFGAFLAAETEQFFNDFSLPSPKDIREAQSGSGGLRAPWEACIGERTGERAWRTTGAFTLH